MRENIKKHLESLESQLFAIKDPRVSMVAGLACCERQLAEIFKRPESAKCDPTVLRRVVANIWDVLLSRKVEVTDQSILAFQSVYQIEFDEGDSTLVTYCIGSIEQSLMTLMGIGEYVARMGLGLERGVPIGPLRQSGIQELALQLIFSFLDEFTEPNDFAAQYKKFACLEMQQQVFDLKQLATRQQLTEFNTVRDRAMHSGLFEDLNI